MLDDRAPAEHISAEGWVRIRTDVGDGYTARLWAEPVGGDLERLDNISFFADGLVRASGRRTLRIFFAEGPIPTRTRPPLRGNNSRTGGAN